MTIHSPTPSHRRSSRAGISVLEVSIALLILGAALTILAQLLTAATTQRRAGEARRLALQEVANQAERIALLPWDETAADKLSGLKPSQQLLDVVPSAKLGVSQTAEAGPPEHKRIRLEVEWTDSVGQTVEPVGLTIWKHKPPEAKP